MLQHSFTLNFVSLLRNTVEHVQSDQMHMQSGRTKNVWDRILWDQMGPNIKLNGIVGMESNGT